MNDSDIVLAAFSSKFPSMGIRASLVISRAGDPTDALEQPGKRCRQNCKGPGSVGTADTTPGDVSAGQPCGSGVPGHGRQRDAVFAAAEEGGLEAQKPPGLNGDERCDFPGIGALVRNL